MALIVQKFGGTSVGNPEKIKNVARRVLKKKNEGNQMVVVLSAMSGETNRLTDFAMAMQEIPDTREMDVLLSSGEQVTISLFSMAVKAMEDDCISFLGDQVKILTDSSYTKARIEYIDTEKISASLDDGKVVVVAGFQGVDENGNITTLGRGGSDTTAVALAAVLQADACEIFTDVEGVYTTDPNMCVTARKIDRISYDEMLELASLGAKVLDIRSVTFAKQYNVPIHVRSTFTETEGTWVVEEDKEMEGRIVSGVTYNRNEARITISGVPDQPGIATKIFTPISNADIIVDMIIQNQNTGEGTTDMTFTVLRSDYERTLKLLDSVVQNTQAKGGVQGSDTITKISIVGVGMRNHSGIASTMFSVLANEGINISMISTSEIKVSCIIEEKYTELAVRALHDAFELGKDCVAVEETLV
jgi:aspartate kinase